MLERAVLSTTSPFLANLRILLSIKREEHRLFFFYFFLCLCSVFVRKEIGEGANLLLKLVLNYSVICRFHLESFAPVKTMELMTGAFKYIV